MDKQIYLIAIGLIEQAGKRFMPLGGKSIKKENSDEGEIDISSGRLLLELQQRIIQKSENSPIKRSAGENSLLLVEIEFSEMNAYIPKLKARWIKDGDTQFFINELLKRSQCIWNVNFYRHEGIKFTKV